MFSVGFRFPGRIFRKARTVIFGILELTSLHFEKDCTVCCGLISTLFFINSPTAVKSNQLFLWIPLRAFAFHLPFLHFPRFSVQIPRVSNFPREFYNFPVLKKNSPTPRMKFPGTRLNFPGRRMEFPGLEGIKPKKSDSVNERGLRTAKAPPRRPCRLDRLMHLTEVFSDGSLRHFPLIVGRFRCARELFEK